MIFALWQSSVALALGDLIQTYVFRVERFAH